MMQQHSKLTDNLRRWILAILQGPISSQDLNGFVVLCHSIAVAAVRKKITIATLQSRILHETHSDLAYDCIADLFRQDEAGNIAQVKAYFEGLACQTASEQELLAHLRRLVFSKVNQGIYRAFNDVDPALGKILRNIKLAVQTLQNFNQVERFGATCLFPSSCDTLEHLPTARQVDLECGVRRFANGSENIPTLLAKLSLYLREEKEHSRIVPLLSVGLVFKSLYEKHETTEATSTEVEEKIETEDVLTVIRRTCKKVKEEMGKRYLRGNKLSKDVFNIYFVVIEETLSNRLLGTNGNEHSLFKALKDRLPDLTKQTYASKHRARLEYLARITYEGAVHELKRGV